MIFPAAERLLNLTVERIINSMTVRYINSMTVQFLNSMAEPVEARRATIFKSRQPSISSGNGDLKRFGSRIRMVSAFEINLALTNKPVYRLLASKCVEMACKESAAL